MKENILYVVVSFVCLAIQLLKEYIHNVPSTTNRQNVSFINNNLPSGNLRIKNLCQQTRRHIQSLLPRRHTGDTMEEGNGT